MYQKEYNKSDSSTLYAIEGARIGRTTAPWPIVDLKVDSNRLELNAAAVGNLVFKPDDIISFEIYTSFPVIGRGIIINHKIKNYKEHVFFWSAKNPYKIIEKIKQTGFLENRQSILSVEELEAIDLRQSQGAYPFKIAFTISYFIILSALLFIDNINYLLDEKIYFSLFTGSLLGFGFIFLTATLALLSEKFRKVALKEGTKIR